MRTFTQWLEAVSYNRDLLNNMMKKFSSPGLLWGRDVNLDPQEVAEVENVLNQARDKIVAIINQPPYTKMWQDFQAWEKQHGVNLLRFAWPTKVVQKTVATFLLFRAMTTMLSFPKHFTISSPGK